MIYIKIGAAMVFTAMIGGAIAAFFLPKEPVYYAAFAIAGIGALLICHGGTRDIVTTSPHGPPRPKPKPKSLKQIRAEKGIK